MLVPTESGPATPQPLSLSLPPSPSETLFLPPGETQETWKNYYATCDKRQRECIDTQNAFLSVYARKGTILRSGITVGVDRQSTYWWINHNLHRFPERLALAQHAYRERLQDIGLGRIEQQKPNDNPLLLITMLNAEWPEKYRRDTVIVGSDAVKEMLAELVKLAGKGRGQVIEGETVSAEEKVNRMLGPGANAPVRNDAPREKQVNVNMEPPKP